jgi:hypothetical protein
MSFAPVQESDRVPGRKLAAIGIAGVAIMLASIFVAWLLMRARSSEPEQQASAAPPPAALGTVERGLFDETSRGLDERAAHRRELDGLGWVDRDAGIAHIPIDRAIDMVVARDARDAGNARDARGARDADGGPR